MEKDTDIKYTVKLEAKPERVVSNGVDEVVLKCTIGSGKKNYPKEEVPVSLSIKKQRFREEKTARKGSVTFKVKPAKPTGRTRVDCETPYGKDSTYIFVSPTRLQYVRDMAWSILLAFILAFGIIRPFILQTFYIPSASMEPTLYEHDRLVGLMFPYRFRDPHPGEVVIFTRPGVTEEKRIPFTPIKWQSHTKFIKRVIAVGGDTVDVKYHQIYVNGKPLDEPFTKDMLHERDMRTPYKVPEGHLFLMGDNRNNSNDARYWGPGNTPQALEKKYVMSKAVLLFWPPNRAGLIRSYPRKFK